MNILMILLVLVGGAVGLFSTGYIVFSLINTIAFKIYRKCKYNISLYD